MSSGMCSSTSEAITRSKLRRGTAAPARRPDRRRPRRPPAPRRPRHRAEQVAHAVASSSTVLVEGDHVARRGGTPRRRAGPRRSPGRAPGRPGRRRAGRSRRSASARVPSVRQRSIRVAGTAVRGAPRADRAPGERCQHPLASGPAQLRRARSGCVEQPAAAPRSSSPRRRAGPGRRTARPADHLGQRAGVGGHQRRRAGHGLDGGQREALVQRRHARRSPRRADELDELRRRRSPWTKRTASLQASRSMSCSVGPAGRRPCRPR